MIFCWLQVKVSKPRPIGHKLTCGTNRTNMFLFFIIIWSRLQVTSLLNKLDLDYKFDCVMCFVSVIVIRVHYDIETIT